MTVKQFIDWIEISKMSHGNYVDYDNLPLMVNGKEITGVTPSWNKTSIEFFAL